MLKHFHFVFLFFWITKRRQLACHKFRLHQERRHSVLRYFAKRRQDFYKKQCSRRARFIIQCRQLRWCQQLDWCWQLGHCPTSLHHIADSPFLLLLLTFLANCQTFGLVRWAVNVYISRFCTIPNFIGPWSLHMSRSRFSTIYIYNQFWFGPWSDKDLIGTNLVFTSNTLHLDSNTPVEEIPLTLVWRPHCPFKNRQRLI